MANFGPGWLGTGGTTGSLDLELQPPLLVAPLQCQLCSGYRPDIVYSIERSWKKAYGSFPETGRPAGGHIELSVWVALGDTMKMEMDSDVRRFMRAFPRSGYIQINSPWTYCTIP